MRLAIGARYRHKLQGALEEHEVQTIWLPDNMDVDDRLAGHADLSIFSAAGTVIAAKGIYPYIANKLTNRVHLLESTLEQHPAYPGDAALCVCHTGKYLIYNPKTADPAIPEHVHSIPIKVNQGYTMCSVCVVADEAIITSDSAISSRALQAGMDVLMISPGSVELDGFDYGFIGGATFLLSKTKLAFTGTLSAHPDQSRILAFLEKHQVKPVFLTNDPIFDIGGAVTIP